MLPEPTDHLTGDELRYDVILIGAGGAGMCLLHAMQHSGYLDDTSLLVLEPDAKTDNDRTWCFWADDVDPILAGPGRQASHSWHYAEAGGRLHKLHPYRYHHLRSADLYRQVKENLAVFPGVSWLPLHAEQAEQTGDTAWVTAGGRRFCASWVFDSRLAEDQQQLLQDDPHLVWQSFWGVRVRLLHGAFDPEAVRLMDFDVEQAGATQFLYLLPLSAQDALVELTRFGTDRIDKAGAQTLLEDWITLHYGAFEVLETEAGAIPMTQRLEPAAPLHDAGRRIIPIGTAAGAVKSSTGYAFKTMYAHALGLVEALQAGKAAPTPRHSPRHGFYDGLLLHILAHKPQWGKSILEQLFRRMPMHRVLSFLDEKTTLLQDIPLLLSLPLRPFLQAVVQKYILPSREAPAPRLADALPALIALAALGLQFFLPEILQTIGPPLLVLGMVFPGIPHGALDHCTGPAGLLKGRRLAGFVGSYLSIMALVLLVWMLSPALGVALFLLYSAWHFGETDVRHWNAFHPLRAWLQGASVLGFLLAVHPGEFAAYLQALGVADEVALPGRLMQGMVVLSAAGLLASGWGLSMRAAGSWLQTLLVVFSGAFLPLIPAFGVYFIGVHSVRGWFHLRYGLNSSTATLLRKAMPFSLGAYGLFALLLVLDRFAGLPFEGMIPGLFVFLAAVSAPHIWHMHRFYGRSA